MRTKDLQNILGEMRSIKADEGYVARSRMLVLSSPRLSKSDSSVPETNDSLSKFLWGPVRIVSFVTAGFLLIFSLYSLSQELSPLFLPGLNQKKITAEAEAVDAAINIHLSQIAYFEKTSKETSKILEQIAVKQLDHLNEIVIQKETEEIASSLIKTGSLNQEIADLLKAVSE